MKKSMSEYIKTLSENDFSILEEIIQCKYRKFIKLYWMLRDHSDLIVDMNYDTNQLDNSNTLLINLKVSDKNIEKLYSKIEKYVYKNDEEQISIDMNKNKGFIYIEIFKNESELP